MKSRWKIADLDVKSEIETEKSHNFFRPNQQKANVKSSIHEVSTTSVWLEVIGSSWKRELYWIFWIHFM